MTREKALKTWLPVVEMAVANIPEVKEALEMAIEALEQEDFECCDAISRESVIETLNAGIEIYCEYLRRTSNVAQVFSANVMASCIIESIEKMPSIQPAHRMKKLEHNESEVQG